MRAPAGVQSGCYPTAKGKASCLSCVILLTCWGIAQAVVVWVNLLLVRPGGPLLLIAVASIMPHQGWDKCNWAPAYSSVPGVLSDFIGFSQPDCCVAVFLSACVRPLTVQYLPTFFHGYMISAAQFVVNKSDNPSESSLATFSLFRFAQTAWKPWW